MKSVHVVAGVLVALLSSTAAHAEKPRGEISVLAGYGSSSIGTYDDNNFGFGSGVRVGLTVGHFWAGLTAIYQVGSPSGIGDIDAAGNQVTGDYSLSTFSGGGELGGSWSFARSSTGWLVFRPFVWVGTNVYTPSPLNTFHSETELKEPLVRFVVAPSLHVDYELARSGIFFGADLRVNLLVPGTAPKIAADDWHFPAAGWSSEEKFTAEISVFGVIGKRF
jgi:hypothetical protein